jgi:hypothetical protein
LEVPCLASRLAREEKKFEDASPERARRFERNLGVGGVGAAIDVPDGALLVHHIRDALRHAEETEHAIEFRNGLLRVTQQRELQPELLRKSFVGGLTVDADAEN